ncbi:MAG: DUF2283 domain-containing protein [Patescibacteria group bacterium]
MKLYYYYDKEADVFYFSNGKPSAKDKSEEVSNDVILRTDPKTGAVHGFTILNFAERVQKKQEYIALPIEANLVPA